MLRVELTSIPHYISWTIAPGDFYSYHTGVLSLYKSCVRSHTVVRKQLIGLLTIRHDNCQSIIPCMPSALLSMGWNVYYQVHTVSLKLTECVQQHSNNTSISIAFWCHMHQREIMGLCKCNSNTVVHYINDNSCLEYLWLYMVTIFTDVVLKPHDLFH